MTRKSKRPKRYSIVLCLLLVCLSVFIWANLQFLSSLAQGRHWEEAAGGDGAHTLPKTNNYGLHGIKNKINKQSAAEDVHNQEKMLRGSVESGPFAIPENQGEAPPAAYNHHTASKLKAHPATTSTVASYKKEGVVNDVPPSPGLGLGPDTLLLVMASARPDYLQRCLDKVVQYHPLHAVSIVVSEDYISEGDRNHHRVKDVVDRARKSLRARGATVPFYHDERPADKISPSAPNRYFSLASHFKASLTEAFSDVPWGQQTLATSPGGFQRVIILEEDLDIAPDFFDYFGAVKDLVDTDPTVLAASAFNDNGFGDKVKDADRVFRSDFFPGLGWMLHRRVWSELVPKWPRAYWDDWLREPQQRRERHTLRPEVCRTFHYGDQGVSSGQFSNALHKIKLNKHQVNWATQDLTYLQSETWQENYLTAVNRAPVVSIAEAKQLITSRSLPAAATKGVVKVLYKGTASDFENTARQLGLMDNIKAGVPRTAYRGVVSFWAGSTQVHLTPRSGPSTVRIQ